MQKFAIEALKIGKTSRQFDLEFEMPSLRRLEVINNNYFVANCLRKQSFQNLQSVTLINCKRLRLMYLAELILTARDLKTLQIVDSFKGKQQFLLDFLQVAISHCSKVEMLRFEFTEPHNCHRKFSA